MNTSYQQIYNLFLSKIKDFDLPLMTDEELSSYCESIMISALTKIHSFENDLTQMNSELKEFASELNTTELEVIACQMVVEWVDKKINNTQLLHMFAGTKDESMMSQANHMRAMIELKDKQRATVSNLIRDYKYKAWVNEEG